MKPTAELRKSHEKPGGNQPEVGCVSAGERLIVRGSRTGFSSTRKVEPSPSILSTLRVKPILSQSDLEMVRPSPVPPAERELELSA